MLYSYGAIGSLFLHENFDQPWPPFGNTYMMSIFTVHMFPSAPYNLSQTGLVSVFLGIF